MLERNQQPVDQNVAVVRVAAIPEPEPADIDEINRRFAVQPLAAEDVFVFRGVISTDAVDSYFTRMDPATTLRNFAEDFSEGQALLDSHNQWSSVAILGRSFRASVEPVLGRQLEGQLATAQVPVRWYMTRDEDSEKLIRRILAGTLSRMSVGFGGLQMRIVSDQDGKDLFQSDYYPGQRLPDGARATFTIFEARGMEGSLVYKNSTPGSLVTQGRVAAIVARIDDLAKRREIDPQACRELGAAWGVRFADAPSLYQGLRLDDARARAQERKEDEMSFADLVQARIGKKLSADTRGKLESVASKIGEARDVVIEVLDAVAKDVTEEDRSALSSLRTQVVGAAASLGIEVPNPDQVADAIRAYNAKLTELRTMADDGKRWRESLITEALTEGKRAMGAEFAEETYGALLRAPGMEIAAIRRMRDDWQTIGDKRWGQGRSSTDGDPEPQLEQGQQPESRQRQPIPMAAYR